MSGSPAAMAAFIHKAAVEKAKNDTADRKHKAATGAAMASGSYPIANEADLDKAIHAVGRGNASAWSDTKAHHPACPVLGRQRRRSRTTGTATAASRETPCPRPHDVATVVKDIGPDLDGDPADDGMDLTTPLAEPEQDDAPGDPTDPRQSPAWEDIDAATAQKWTSIAVRLKNALRIMADREMQEAATGADPGDADNAFDLQDAMCAIDFAIDTLASFAVGEQVRSGHGFGGAARADRQSDDRVRPGPGGHARGAHRHRQGRPGAVVARTRPGYVTPPRRCKVCLLACLRRRRSPTAASRSPKRRRRPWPTLQPRPKPFPPSRW